MCRPLPDFSSPHPLTRDLFWAPRPLIWKWTSLDLSWVMARGICGTLSPSAHRPRLRFLTRPPSLSLGVYSFPAEPGHSIMSEIPLQSRPVSHRQHWTVPVSWEETLAVREKFRRVGWRALNHKPKTTKIVAWAKNLWVRYLTPGDLQVVCD
jgi:hypothetical protein